MAEQLFLEGQPPDFSVLQRLLCLEPEPCHPLLPPPSPGEGATTDSRRGGIPEPPPGPWSPPAPPGEGLSFLQETALLLAPPELPPAPPPAAAPPELPRLPPAPPGSPDALSLISLQCRHLAAPGIPGGTPGIPGITPGTGSGRRRKQAAPRRGAEPRDPSFRGVTLRMRLGPGGAEGCSLLITARGGGGGRDPGRSRGRRSPAGPPEMGSGSEDDAPLAQGSKRCASCKTRRTPLWRAAKNGTPLCNACGIRYRKYRVRCRRCWSIPGKSGTPGPQCPHCGEWCHPAGSRRR